MFRKKNTGKHYEELVEYVYKKISEFSRTPIKVERNIKKKGKSGLEHQIDVYYEFELNDITHKVIIECKDHKEKVEKSLVQAFKGVLDDIGNCTGIFVSRNGFQSGAIEYSKYYDIELVSGGELPLLSKVAIKSIGILLPDKSVMGEPFWTIMEVNNGKVTGTYICVEEKTIGLFLTRKCAEEVAKKTGGVVRGVCQRHLRCILLYAKRGELKLCMFILDKDRGLLIEPKVIEEYFVL